MFVCLGSVLENQGSINNFYREEKMESAFVIHSNNQNHKIIYDITLFLITVMLTLKTVRYLSQLVIQQSTNDFVMFQFWRFGSGAWIFGCK